MGKRLKVIIISASILVIGFVCVFGWCLNNSRLDVYFFADNGHSIYKDTNHYVFNAISNGEIIGKAIGKAEYNGEKYYIYQEKGKDIHDYIIIMGVDIGVAEEFISSNK
ncbi:hypothetical protein [Clostridium magnum]|uniref:hypothetical protein n=1 Tax=Clostridium magnum TaxID=33954 RepID=UPI000913AF64|nr:hypothetical protein [Clostridium magnum]SHI14922.1 hypothetical protein SAMN02745944_02769 [Clostridium magnum DSM 2767]